MSFGSRRHPSRLATLLVVAAWLAACAAEAPPPAFDGSDTTAAPAASADVSAYDAEAPQPVATTTNTVTAETQQAELPPPLPPADTSASSAAATSGATVDGITYPVTASFVEGYPTIIEVQIRDQQAADKVELVAPGGGATAAYQLDTTSQVSIPRQDDGVDVGIVASGGSSGGVRTGIGIGFPLFGSAEAPEPVTEVLTRARIRLANTAAYQADWRHWVVRIRFGMGSANERKTEIPAPQPPAAS